MRVSDDLCIKRRNLQEKVDVGDIRGLEELLKRDGLCIDPVQGCCGGQGRSYYGPLSRAIQKGRLDMVKLLMHYGAHVHGAESGALKPLQHCMETASSDVLENYRQIIKYLMPYYAADYDSGRGLIVSPPCVLEQLLPEHYHLQGRMDTPAEHMVLGLFEEYGWTIPPPLYVDDETMIGSKKWKQIMVNKGLSPHYQDHVKLVHV